MNKTPLDEVLFQLTGEDETTIWQYARTVTDPWTYLKEIDEELQQKSTDLDLDLDLYEWNNKLSIFLSTIDASLETKRQHNTTDKWYQSPDPNQSPQTRYNPRDFYRDKVSNQSQYVAFFTEARISESSRNEWRRVTINDNVQTRLLTEYGNFDLGTTHKAARALLRVRTNIRHGNPYLSVGAVQINLRTGHIKCGVNGCKHEGQLTRSDNSRVWFEFTILCILAHLGTHQIGKGQIFPTIPEVKRYRDTPEEKLETHYRFCNNPKCACDPSKRWSVRGWVEWPTSLSF